MKSTTYYLNELAKLTETGSDYAVAKLLGISSQRIYSYRSGTNFDDEMCFRVANELNIEAAEIIAVMNYQRAKTEKKKAFWINTFENVKKSAAACLIMGFAILENLASSGHAAIYESLHCILCKIAAMQKTHTFPKS